MILRLKSRLNLLYNNILARELTGFKKQPIPLIRIVFSHNMLSLTSSQTEPPSPTDKPLISLNISTMIIEKLTSSIFLQWCAKFEALITGYDLIDYVTRDHLCPVPMGCDRINLSLMLSWPLPSQPSLLSSQVPKYPMKVR